jgi:hypothetical protein
MEEDAKRHEIQQFSKSLISGDERDKRVKDILNRLAHARGELHLCITMIYIGLTGNLESGFRVARGQLQRINDTVQKLYGHQVLLAKLLEPRWQNLTQDGETEQFLLEPEDVLVLGLADEDSADGTYISESNILDWHNNTTTEDAAITGRKFRISSRGTEEPRVRQGEYEEQYIWQWIATSGRSYQGRSGFL